MMRDMGDFQRLLKRGDPRIRKVFSHIRQIVDLLEDIANRPHKLLPEPEQAQTSVTLATTPASPSSQTEAGERAPLLISVKEASRLVGISRSRIYSLINDGSLETVMIGNRRLVRYVSLQQLAGQSSTSAPL